jgi:hypothetical protein
MLNSAILCRQREAHHRKVAADATLANVRKIALAAAAAWAEEAEQAEALETGGVHGLSAEDAEIALEFLDDDLSDEADNDADAPDV